jgi:hypothetical protein
VPSNRFGTLTTLQAVVVTGRTAPQRADLERVAGAQDRAEDGDHGLDAEVEPLERGALLRAQKDDRHGACPHVDRDSRAGSELAAFGLPLDQLVPPQEEPP